MMDTRMNIVYIIFYLFSVISIYNSRDSIITQKNISNNFGRIYDEHINTNLFTDIFVDSFVKFVYFRMQMLTSCVDTIKNILNIKSNPLSITFNYSILILLAYFALLFKYLFIYNILRIIFSSGQNFPVDKWVLVQIFLMLCIIISLKLISKYAKKHVEKFFKYIIYCYVAWCILFVVLMFVYKDLMKNSTEGTELINELFYVIILMLAHVFVTCMLLTIFYVKYEFIHKTEKGNVYMFQKDRYLIMFSYFFASILVTMFVKNKQLGKNINSKFSIASVIA